MKQHSIKELSAHLSVLLKDLPFEITNHNVPIALVTAISDKPIKILKNISPPDKPEIISIKVEPAPYIPPAQQEVVVEDPLDIGRCVFRGCPMKGPMRQDWKEWNEVIAETVSRPSYACKKHYLAFLKVKDTL